MKKTYLTVAVLALVFGLFGRPADAQRSTDGRGVRRIDTVFTPPQPHLVGIKVNAEEGVVELLPQTGREVVNAKFSMVSASCLDCGGGCPSFSRSVAIVLQANVAVAGGYGVSSLTSGNYSVTGVGYSTQAALAPGQQTTITVTGTVLDCSTNFNVYFDMCDSTPSNWADSCPVSFGPVGVLNTNAGGDSGGDQYPQVTTDQNGNWVAVWHSREDLSGTIGTDEDIFVSRSTDNGATWTLPVALNTNAGSDSEDDSYPEVTTDRNGTWVAAWESWDSLVGSIGTDLDILYSRSFDNGATWTPPAVLNNNAGSDSGFDRFPQITTDGDGNWVAVWQSNENLGGATGTDLDIFVSRSADTGATWTSPAALNTNAGSDSGNDFKPQATTDGAGNWVAMWYSYDDMGGTVGTDADILVSRSTDNGLTWTSPTVLNTNAAVDSGGDNFPQVTTDGIGNWVAVWQSNVDLGGIGTDDDVFVSRSINNGLTWTVPAALNTNAAGDLGNDRTPQVTTDGKGNWVATWYSDEDLGGTIGTDNDILASRSTDAGVSWGAVAALNTNAGSDSGFDYGPEVTTDGSGNWVAVWFSTETLSSTIGTDYDIFFSLGH